MEWIFNDPGELLKLLSQTNMINRVNRRWKGQKACRPSFLWMQLDEGYLCSLDYFAFIRFKIQPNSKKMRVNYVTYIWFWITIFRRKLLMSYRGFTTRSSVSHATLQILFYSAFVQQTLQNCFRMVPELLLINNILNSAQNKWIMEEGGHLLWEIFWFKSKNRKSKARFSQYMYLGACARQKQFYKSGLLFIKIAWEEIWAGFPQSVSYSQHLSR